MELERPNAPLECLAAYLLKHKNKIELPEKPPVVQGVVDEAILSEGDGVKQE